MEISNTEWDRKDCRISPREAQYFSGQDILKKGQQRMEIKPYDISETVLCKASSRNKSFYRKSDNSAPRVLLLGNKPLESGSKYISTKLGESKGICFSPLFSSWSISEKNPERASKPYINCTSMAVASMVSMPVADVHTKSNFVAKIGKLFQISNKGKLLISPKHLSASGGMGSIHENLLAEEILQESAELIAQSRRQGTKSHYKSAWREFCGWCSGKKIDPFRCSLASVLQFLTEQFHEGREYNRIAGYR